MTEQEIKLAGLWKTEGYSAESIALIFDAAAATIRNNLADGRFGSTPLKPWVYRALNTRHYVPPGLQELHNRFQFQIKVMGAHCKLETLEAVLGLPEPSRFISGWLELERKKLAARVWALKRQMQFAEEERLFGHLTGIPRILAVAAWKGR